MRRWARRQHPLQSVPSPLPQISPLRSQPCPSFSWRYWPRQSQARPLRILPPPRSRCPSSCSGRCAGQWGQGSCGQVAPVTGSRHHYHNPARALPPSLPLSGSPVVRGGIRTGDVCPPAPSCQLCPQKLPDSARHAPRWQHWSCIVGGSQQQARSLRPCLHPTALLMLPLRFGCPKGSASVSPGRAELAALRASTCAPSWTDKVG